MILRLSVIAAAAVGVVLAGNPADAGSVQEAECRDPQGRQAVLVYQYINNVGIASRLPDGRPVIYLNPAVLQRFQPVTRTFWYYHECAHHVLGHTSGHRPPSREADADCWAIREMRRRGLVTAASLQVIQRDLHPLPGSPVHLPGPERAAHVGACARMPTPDMVNRNPGPGTVPPVARRDGESREARIGDARFGDARSGEGDTRSRRKPNDRVGDGRGRTAHGRTGDLRGPAARSGRTGDSRDNLQGDLH